MKLSELIENYKRIAIFCDRTSTKSVILELQGLEKSQKPVVPQFVADWYEKKKHDLNHYIWDYIYNWNHQEESEFKRWMNCSITTFQTLVNMHQFGYEVEEEKRYKVVMPNVSSSGGVLTRIKHNDSWIWIDTLGTIVEGRTHTRKELEEAGFGWVFDCPGIKIEEVE